MTNEMLVGTYYHTLESKGRLSLPKSFRAQASSWTITAGLDGCLFVFKSEDFAAQAAKLAQLSYFKAKNRQIIRHFTSHASEQTPDSLGRLTLSDDLRQLGSLQKNIVIVGALDHLEIWDQDRYHASLDAEDGNIESIAEEIEL